MFPIRRRLNPDTKGASVLDLEQLTARPREHLEFTLWYLVQKQLVKRSDNSRFVITAGGVDDLEQGRHQTLQRKRLQARSGEPSNTPLVHPGSKRSS